MGVSVTKVHSRSPFPSLSRSFSLSFFSLGAQSNTVSLKERCLDYNQARNKLVHGSRQAVQLPCFVSGDHSTSPPLPVTFLSLYPVMYLPCDCQLLRIEHAPGVSEHRSLLRRWCQEAGLVRKTLCTSCKSCCDEPPSVILCSQNCKHHRLKFDVGC